MSKLVEKSYNVLFRRPKKLWGFLPTSKTEAIAYARVERQSDGKYRFTMVEHLGDGKLEDFHNATAYVYDRLTDDIVAKIPCDKLQGSELLLGD